ncbi:hypothetical protein N9878_02750 [bacterium]|nr:hypothetical protein [bacterium]
MAGKKNSTIFSWSAIARKADIVYDYIRGGRLSEEEKARTKEIIEADASELLGKTYQLTEVEPKGESNACGGNCLSCSCPATE